MKQPRNQAEMEWVLRDEEHRYERDCPDSFLCQWERRMVTCDFAEKTCEFAFQTTPLLGNPNNVVHGGMTACMLDNVMGVLVRCYSKDGHISPTIDLSVSYLVPISLGVEARVRARIIRVGRSLAFCEAEVFEAERPERIAAVAKATFSVML